MPCDATLRVEDVPAHLKTSFGLRMPAEAVFVEQPRGNYRDGLAFANGTRLSLPELGPDIRVSVVHLLDDKAATPAIAEPVEASRTATPAFRPLPGHDGGGRPFGDRVSPAPKNRTPNLYN